MYPRFKKGKLVQEHKLNNARKTMWLNQIGSEKIKDNRIQEQKLSSNTLRDYEIIDHEPRNQTSGGWDRSNTLNTLEHT